jgi:hypothetical protein
MIFEIVIDGLIDIVWYDNNHKIVIVQIFIA